MSQCKKFAPNIFHKTKCTNCFRQKEEHSAEALECNRASRSIARSGYLFVAPDWDFSVPLNRTKRWQRRWFVLYDDGELNYSVDEHPDTIPQGSVDMTKVLEVTGAEQITGHPHSLALTSPDRVTFVKAASREDARWWVELLAVFPRRHKRNATFPGGRASPSLPHLGRSASPQPPRPSRHFSTTGPSPRTNFETPPLKEERESPAKEEQQGQTTTSNSSSTASSPSSAVSVSRPEWLPVPTGNVTIENSHRPSPIRNEYLISSGSPPTRDKLRCDDKARARRDWRNERLRDIATALTDRSPESSLALPAESLLHLKKGWLWLRTADGESLRRWVVLCGHTLNIYQEQQDEHNTPEIAIELSSVTSYNEAHTESKYGFEIKWSGGSPLVLSAVTSGIRSNWLAALKKAAPISSPPTSPTPSSLPTPSSQATSPSSTTTGGGGGGAPSFQSATNSPITTPTATTPLTPRSLMMFSSDEEYRTASEGGRRGSEDWGELPPSSPPPPSARTSLNRVKDRTRLRPNRLPRCQSRQSTLDSTSTDELDCAKVSSDGSTSSLELMNNTLNNRNVEINDLQTQLNKAVEEVKSLEEEIARLKKFQAEAMIQEKKATEMMLAFERTERELNQRNSQAEMKFSKEQRHLQRLLYEAEENAKTYENRCQALSRDLQTKQRISASLQEEIKNSNERLLQSREENDRLVKRLQQLQERLQDEYEKNTRQIIKKNLGPLGVDSITELMNIDLDLDIDELGPNEIKEYCLDLRGRFERAILEIRAVKKELRESYEKCDNLELANFGLIKDREVEKQERKAEVDLFVARLEHLTSKLNAVEKQLRLKSKGESRDKRRSLSLKGRESFSINKEVEDKVTELEAKILALESSRSKRSSSSKHGNRRDRSSERSSPIDDRQLRRLRRKSLDSATASEPMKLLMRLSTLENKVTNVDEPNAADTGSSNLVSHITCSTPNNNSNTRSTASGDAGSPAEKSMTEMDAEDQDALSLARSKIKECLCQVNLLRNNLNAGRRSASPGRDTLAALEQNLNQLGDLFDEDNELSAITSSAAMAVKQLQRLLSEKLSTLAERKRRLRETNRLDPSAKLEILAEKVAYEKILIGRLQEALLSSPNANGETICDRLVNRELKETVHLMTALQNKLTASDSSTTRQMYSKCRTTGETSARQMSACKTSVTYLTNVLARCLTTAARDFACTRNFTRTTDGSGGEGSARVKLLRSEQNKLNALLQEYKTTKLPQLAEALAADTVAMSASADRSCSRLLVLPEETVENFSNAARNTVNAELIATEINHVLLKTAQMYQSNTQSDHMYFFSFFAAERAALELWSDSVADRLYEEINRNIGELTDLYQNQLSKLQRQNWRRRSADFERNAARISGALLQDFADIVAHKALVDARIDVLTGQTEDASTATPRVENSKTNLVASWLENDSCWDHLDAAVADQTMVQITNENQSLVEAEFTCMLDRFSEDCYALIDQYHQPELDQVVGYLNDLSDEMDELRKHTNGANNGDFESRPDGGVVKTWTDVCQRCKLLRDKLKEVSRGLERTLASRGLIRSQSFKRFESLDDLRPTSLGTEYLTQVEHLRASYRCALASCKERHREIAADVDALQGLCERVLAAMEQWHRRTVQEMREAHARDLDALRRDKEQALAEETQATLAALDAMRKAHEAEVQREVQRFKQEFARQQRDDILDLSERLSVKCLEAAALEEQLGSATRQLTHAQQHILQLERRNNQLSPMQN